MDQQRLRWGFPPRELRPSSDPTHPVELTNGERVSVDVVSGGVDGGVSERTGTEGQGREKGAEGGTEDEDSAKRKEQDIESTRKGRILFTFNLTQTTNYLHL